MSESTLLLSAIRNWNIAAESEQASRYFYLIPEVREIEQGSVSFIIGHKGSGKSAIGEWFDDAKSPSRVGRSVKLSLKDFRFEDLYSITSSSSFGSSKYITLWTYIIICSICNIIRNDETIDSNTRKLFKRNFKKEYNYDSIDINSIINRGFGFSIFGIFGLNFGSKQLSPTEKIAYFEKTIRKFEDLTKRIEIAKPYYIIFDELDEDYHDIVGNQEHYENFRNLIVGLIRSIEQLNKIFKEGTSTIRPLVLLRKDLYESINFNDMGKLANRVRDISWDRTHIQNMISFRLARSLDEKVEAPQVGSFISNWEKLFDLEDFRKNDCDTWQVFQYIYQRSYMRPRDYISFLILMSQAAYDRVGMNAYPSIHRLPSGIQVSDIEEADKRYSAYLHQEVRDSMIGIHNALPSMLGAITDIGKRKFSYTDLNSAISNRKNDDIAKSLTNGQIIDLLFYFNVLGRRMDDGQSLFSYENRDSKPSASWSFSVHKGLWLHLKLTKISYSSVKKELMKKY